MSGLNLKVFNPSNAHADRHRQFCLGILVGIVLSGSVCVCFVLVVGIGDGQSYSSGRVQVMESGSALPLGGLYVAVLSKPRTLPRALAVIHTWGRGVTNINVFMPDGKPLEINSNMMEHTDETQQYDIRPTASKLKIISYLCNHMLSRTSYDWFMLSPDDVTVHVTYLGSILHSLDESKPVLIGGKVNTTTDRSHVCSSTPTMIMSRPLLKDLCPLLYTCLHEKQYLAHDEGISNCVYTLTNVKCTSLPQIDWYHRFNDNIHEAFALNSIQCLSQVHNDSVAVVYPIYQPWMMYRLHSLHLLQMIRQRHQVIENLRNKYSLLGVYQSERDAMESTKIADNMVLMDSKGRISATCANKNLTHISHRDITKVLQTVYFNNIDLDVKKIGQNPKNLQLYTSVSSTAKKTFVVDNIRVINATSSSTQTFLIRNHVTISPIGGALNNTVAFESLTSLWIVIPLASSNDKALSRILRSVVNADDKLQITAFLLILHTFKENKSSSINNILKNYPRIIFHKVTIETDSKQHHTHIFLKASRFLSSLVSRNDCVVLFVRNYHDFRKKFLERCVSLASSRMMYIALPRRHHLPSATNASTDIQNIQDWTHTSAYCLNSSLFISDPDSIFTSPPLVQYISAYDPDLIVDHSI